MNRYFGLFCSAGVLFNSSELGFDYFSFCTIMLDKETAVILDVAMLCVVEGAQCKTRELP